MKKTIMLIFLFSFSLAFANNLYEYDTLDLKLGVEGSFDLIAEDNSANVKEVTINLKLFPENNYRQNLNEISTLGELQDDGVVFNFAHPQLGTYDFSYLALVETNNNLPKITKKVNYPEIISLKEMGQYLDPTPTIDSENPQIVSLATQLVEGEDDLFKVVFKLANWVEENVDYDLNTLTAESSQKASWVLEHRQGVCDEMTSLFIALCRSVGIPAKFVSGISYTTSELFTENWQPHGWAEVYFADYGWIPFDITFGEYGYVDVTHIKLNADVDSTNPSIKYEWISESVNLNGKDLQFSVDVVDKGQLIPEKILIAEEILAKEINFGSYNLIKGIVKNTADYYAATTLNLAIPKEVEIIGRNRRTIFLTPKEVKETYWVVKLKDNLNENYVYHFPALIYSEKNISVQDEFTASSGKITYSQEEINKLTIQDEDKSYSRKISFNCDYPPTISLNNEELNYSCFVKNIGNTNLENLNFCIDDNCEIIDLSINQGQSQQFNLNSNKIGLNNFVVSVENDLVEKKSSFEYSVMDVSQLDWDVSVPETISYGDVIPITINLKKSSFSPLNNLTLTLIGLTTENIWQIEQLDKDISLDLELDGSKISSENEILIKADWVDWQNATYSKEETIILNGQGHNFMEKMMMFFNRLVLFFV